MLGLKKVFLTLSHPSEVRAGKEKVRGIFLLNTLSIKTEQIIQYQTFWELRIKQKQKSSGKDEAPLLTTAWVNEDLKDEV